MKCSVYYPKVKFTIHVKSIWESWIDFDWENHITLFRSSESSKSQIWGNPFPVCLIRLLPCLMYSIAFWASTCQRASTSRTIFRHLSPRIFSNSCFSLPLMRVNFSPLPFTRSSLLRLTTFPLSSRTSNPESIIESHAHTIISLTSSIDYSSNQFTGNSRSLYFTRIHLWPGSIGPYGDSGSGDLSSASASSSEMSSKLCGFL